MEMNSSKGIGSKREKKAHTESLALADYEDRVLKRWQTPSILQALRMNSVVRMLIITCALFCKYRILNKFVLLIVAQNPKREGIIGCFLSSSGLIQMVFGYLIYRHLKGRRFLLQMVLLVIIMLVEVVHIVAYTSTDEF